MIAPLIEIQPIIINNFFFVTNQSLLHLSSPFADINENNKCIFHNKKYVFSYCSAFKTNPSNMFF